MRRILATEEGNPRAMSIAELTAEQRQMFRYLRTHVKDPALHNPVDITSWCQNAGFSVEPEDAKALYHALSEWGAVLRDQSEANANMAAASILAENPPPTPAEDPAKLKDAYESLFKCGPQGIKHDQDKAPLGMLPAAALEAIAHVFKFGADKYSRDNWQAVVTDDPSRYIDAALRHIYAHADGEHDDPESGLPHLAHAGACICFLLWGPK